MSEETKDIVEQAKQMNFISKDVTRACQLNILILSMCANSTRSQRRSSKEYPKNATQNFAFELLNNVSLQKSRKGHRVEINLVQGKEAQEHGKGKEALKCAKKKGYRPILERIMMTTHTRKS